MNMESRDLDGQVAVITGGGSGIGRATAEIVAQQGGAVVVVDWNGEAAEDAAIAISAAGGSAVAFTGDVSSESDTVRMAQAAVDTFGRLDLLFANAGIHSFGTVTGGTVESWNDIIRVDLTGTFLCARACLPHMERQGKGAIVTTSSDCAIRTSPEAAAYTAAKHGVIGLTRSIAVDYGPSGIRANVVVPGVTNTPGLQKWYSVGERSLEEGTHRAAGLSPLGRVAEPSELGEAVAFLLSDRASFITGAVIVVDGGMTVTYGAD